MGGEITAENRSEGGSSFALVLPLESAGAETEPSAGDDPESHPIAAQVLVVDDNSTNQRVLSLILQAGGIESSLADDGQQAVEMWRDNAFDIIFMDIQMPVMDGLTAVRTIRDAERQSGRARTPILMVSANALPEHVEASRAAGADGHVAKPVTADRLFTAIGRLGSSEPDAASFAA
jgi:CheY-like chemotaxis protein